MRAEMTSTWLVLEEVCESAERFKSNSYIPRWMTSRMKQKIMQEQARLIMQIRRRSWAVAHRNRFASSLEKNAQWILFSKARCSQVQNAQNKRSGVVPKKGMAVWKMSRCLRLWITNRQQQGVSFRGTGGHETSWRKRAGEHSDLVLKEEIRLTRWALVERCAVDVHNNNFTACSLYKYVDEVHRP